MTNLVAGTPVTLSSYQTYSYTCMSAGVLSFELWGAGGGGGVAPATAPTTTLYGGGGGLITGSIVVAAGDVITGTIGEGGRAGQINVAGGDGGRGASTGGAGGRGSTTIAQGGGGGSSDLKINGTTYAIAGAGAAGTGGRGGGDGGGLSGVAGQGSFAVKGTPGTQSAAGNNGASGGNGGNGFATGTTATVNTSSGSGGGAGYWGGGGGRASSAGQYPSAAGGSGFAHASLLNATNTAGSAGVSPSSANKPTHAGDGGTAVSNGTGGNTPGYDGALYLSLVEFPDLPTTPSVVSYTGSPEIYKSPGEGTLTVKMWGGGGGGGANTTTALGSQGGGGGYVSTKIVLHTDDVVQIWVGQGGRAAGATSAGNVAYPDGGFGGKNVTSGFQGGGGGGSTRVYVNGVLLAIAGAGGGGRGTGNTASNETTHGGGGGGSDGGKGYYKSTLICGASGGQSSYAANPGGQTAQDGGVLQGGNGGTTYNTNLNQCGGGGGGGYRGGSGGGNSTTTTGGGGGGGSSWGDASNLSYSTASGVTSGTTSALPGNDTDADRPSGAGQGGLGAVSGTATNGGDGAAIISYSDGIPGDAAGLVGTISVTSAVGSGLGNAAVSGLVAGFFLTAPSAGVPGNAAGLVGTISLSVPTGIPGLGATATGDFGSPITNNGAELGGQGFADALISIPLVDYDLTFGEILGTGSVSTVVNKPFPGPITLTVPKGIIAGYTEGELATLTLSAVEGTASERVEAGGSIGTATLTAISGDAAGNADATQSGTLQLDLTSVDATAYTFVIATSEAFEHSLTVVAPGASVTDGAYPFPGPIELSPFDATTEVGPIEATFGSPITLYPTVGEFTYFATGDLGTLLLAAPAGDFWDGSVDISGDIGSVTLTPGEGEFHYIGYGAALDPISITAFDATVGADGNGYAEFDSDITLAAADGTASGEVNFSAPLPTIALSPPLYAPVRGATILASIIPAKVSLKSPAGVAGEEIAVVADADFGNLAISLSSPEGYVFIDTPGWAVLRLMRSETAGAKPGSLQNREIAINEADGILYTRDGDGNVMGTPLAAIQAGAEVPIEGMSGSFLRGDQTWGSASPTYTAFARLAIPAGNAVLSDAVLDATNFSPTPGLIYYHPFFVPKAVVVSNLAVNVVTAGLGTAYLGICKWVLPQIPDLTVISGSAPPSSIGPLAISGSITLTPGWYAAMLAVTDAGVVFSGYNAPVQLASDFTAAGDPTGAFTGDLESLGSPTGRAANSYALLKANIANV